MVPAVKFDFDEELRVLLSRHKRSAEDKNGTVKFYETIDEIDEDTLKNSNNSGTLEARKISTKDITKLSEHYNASDPTLHIEYNQPHEFEHHIAENKVDSKHPLEETINGLTHEEIHKILGNYSQNIKNRDLSKLVVNELAHGKEIIGDKSVTPLSNITFTPENDTLTAMAFIAGNLLNKLWDMEKDATDGSFETEELKHQKINDLLGLFKEPLSIRQEMFLKNALEKLSNVIDKNLEVKNVSLCTNFEEIANKMDNNNCTEKQTNQGADFNIPKDKNRHGSLENHRKATADAISKINDVINLIKKYENVQKSLNDIKNPQIAPSNHEFVRDTRENLSTDESVSLNLFGDLLAKITKLLSPNKSEKKVTKKLQNYNLLRKDDIAKKNMEKLFNIDLGNKTINTKDRMIMDYLSNVERHPNCFFSHLHKPVVTPLSNVEGSILYNLSEFFKIKSFADLLHLINDKPDVPKVRSTSNNTATVNPTTIRSTTTVNLRTSLKPQPTKQESVKEKLKNDLKTILQDLIELQTEHGIKPNSKINIADALPCIYNILKADNGESNDFKNKQTIDPTNKIKTFIEALKAEMKFMPPSRRSNTNVTPRPKSAVVWERAIKSLDKQHKPPSRRYLTQKQKTYPELRELMDNVEQSSHSYKNFAIQSGVPPSEKLILLKTLHADVKQYTDVLENIQGSIETVTNLPVDKQNEFKEFVDNAAMNINLNKKVLEEVRKPKTNNFVENKKSRTGLLTESKKPLMMSKLTDSTENNNFKLRRDQILNQLIINRLKLYIKNKETSDTDYNSDTNYNIAKRIIFYIESGNIPLAKELFKIFATTKQKENKGRNKFVDYGVPVNSRMSPEPKGPKLLAFKEPIIKVEDDKKIKMLTQDYFIKQLWNLKE
ncbi:uncharacterized protein [Epargyreus clarus]|uniref:uncharacterized protein n=1 Tax=Epargyreus clarus TaxID=520877 RepID=UPI003C30DE58